MEDVFSDYDINNEEQVKQHRLMLFRISRNLRWFMNQKSVNSVDLHRHLGVSTGTITKILSDKYPDYSPSVMTLYPITNYLGITIDDLLREPIDGGNEIGLQNCAPLVNYQA
ncbi:helix-turn-helix domain-containing protein [Cysteiniphilum sp. 6C5]|uniref:helix-turn-helix domain-containing protein n=1 Tax=unclassified Cysteiniphilum TaxID=2610889 RepID=UPI003F842967